MAVRILGFGYLPLRYDPVSNPVVYSILHNVCIVCLVCSSPCVPHQTELVSKYGAPEHSLLADRGKKSDEKHRTFLYVTANIIDLFVLPLNCTVVKGIKSLYFIFRLYLI